ncbi:MAG: DedA family protein [Chromatiaceae bacterium]|jgi:membrane protein DedA with SNARE-associated domain
MISFQHALTGAEPWLREYGYPALALAVGIEGIGVPAPGETLLIGAALLAARGDLNISVVLVTAWLAAITGDNIGYWIGRAGGRPLLSKLRVSPGRLARLESFYRRFGVWLVLVSRFFDGTRQLDGIIAGSARMPWPRFFLFEALGALAWVALWGWGIDQLGRHGSSIHRLLHRINPWVAGVALAAAVLVVLFLVSGRMHHRGDGEAGPPDREHENNGE